MTAPDEKAREIALDIVHKWRGSWQRPADLIDAITAALIEQGATDRGEREEIVEAMQQMREQHAIELIEARRAALEDNQYASVEAASWPVLDTMLDLYRKHGPDLGVLQPLYAKAARLDFALKAGAGALIPTRPDGAAEGAEK